MPDAGRMAILRERCMKESVWDLFSIPKQIFCLFCKEEGCGAKRRKRGVF